MDAVYRCNGCLVAWDRADLDAANPTTRQYFPKSYSAHENVCPHCGGECSIEPPPPMERELTGIERTLGQ